jgi:tetratricopeptide (TPR) repeat protein
LKIPCLYDAGYGTEYANGLFILKKGSKYGVTDSTGKEIVPYTFDKVSWHNKNMFLAVKDDKYGIINSLGTVVIPCTMKSSPPQPINGYFIFFDSNKKYGCIKEDGTPVVPFVVDEDFAKTNYKTAAPYLAKMLTINPDDQWVIYLDALGYCSSAKSKDALDYVTRSINKFSDKKISVPEQLYYIRAIVYTELNDYVAAKDDASRGGSEWGKRAYLYMADKKFQQKDFQGANDFYVRAYVPPTDERRIRVTDELKKQGIQKPTVQNVIHLTPDAVIPTTILGFTNSDRKEASGGNSYKMLYSYNEAVAGTPKGYRMTTVDDWVKLFEYIKKDQYDRYGRQGVDGANYVGKGWSKTYYTEGVMRDKATTYSSANAYDLNISPLRSHKDIGLTGDERVNYIDYWMEPAYYKGKKVNRIGFDDDGYRFEYVEGGNACVRYVKK